MAKGSISEAQTGSTPARIPANGKPPEPSNRLPRVSGFLCLVSLLSMTALRFRLKAGHFLKLQLLPITDDIHIVIMAGLMFDISLDDYINELWIKLNAPACPVGLLTCDQRRSGAQERVQHDGIGHGAVLDGITHQTDGLHGRVEL